jgi:hypothetical protein
MPDPKLFMILLGCTPKGRHTEQHDIFFGIGDSISDLKQQMSKFWPDGGILHIDAWRQVSNVEGFKIEVVLNNEDTQNSNQLFFLNLGGYRENEFDEFHYKMLTVAINKGKAVSVAKQTAFYKHTGLPGAGASHIDDRYGVDVDDIHEIEDILPPGTKEQYQLRITDKADHSLAEDKLNLGYLKWSKL